MTMLSSDYFIFFKQKTAYEMRISDWSSDVCSSDLDRAIERGADHRALQHDDQSQMSRQRNTCRITNQPAECTRPRPNQPRPPGKRRELPKFRQTLLHQPEENEGNETAMTKGGGIPPNVLHTHGVACNDEENGRSEEHTPEQ